ncbi:MAG: hypothetical protein ACE5Q3_16955 [Alphaproteobacteria bacterium]
MRPGLTPEEFRAGGIYLNGGRKRGWRKRVALLLDTPETTIAAWASRSPGNARSIPGTAAVAIKLLVAMLQQREITERDLSLAAEFVTDHVLTLLRVADFVPPQIESVAFGPGGPTATKDQPVVVRPLTSRPRSRSTASRLSRDST